MGEVFKIHIISTYNLRTNNEFFSTFPKTIKYETEIISFLASTYGALVSEKIKECSCLKAFKSKIKKCISGCPYRLCKTYFQHVAFINMHIGMFNTNTHSLYKFIC